MHIQSTYKWFFLTLPQKEFADNMKAINFFNDNKLLFLP